MINLEVYNMEDSNNIVVVVNMEGKVVVKEEVSMKSVEEVEEDVELGEDIKFKKSKAVI